MTAEVFPTLIFTVKIGKLLIVLRSECRAVAAKYILLAHITESYYARSYIGCNIRLDNAVCYAKAFSVILIAFNFFNAYHNHHSVLISFAVYSSPHGSTLAEASE